MKNREVYEWLCALAPLDKQMDFDNAGLQAGRLDCETEGILLSLDVTNGVVDEALRLGANLIVTHHPLIFRPLRSVSDLSIPGSLVMKIIEHGLTVISMHTNLDLAAGGVNDVLFSLFSESPLGALDEDGLGRYGDLPVTMETKDFLVLVKRILGVNTLRYVDSGKPVRRIAVVGGSGGDMFEAAMEKGCDALITADVKYHQFLDAKEAGFTLIDADHFCTENPIILRLKEMLTGRFSGSGTPVWVSQTHHQTICTF